MLIGLNRDQVCGAIALVFVGVPAEVTVELIRAFAAGDDVASVASVDQVITITATPLLGMDRGSAQRARQKPLPL